MPNHNESDTEDRRGLDRRVSALERQFSDLSNKVDRVGQEQTHLREIISTRFAVVDKGLEMISAQMGNLSMNIQTMAGDSNNTAAGRALSKDIATLAHDYAALERRLDESNVTFNRRISERDAVIAEMRTEMDQAHGAIGTVRSIGVSSLLMVVVVVAVWFLRIAKVIP